jgi:hypothetical protein
MWTDLSIDINRNGEVVEAFQRDPENLGEWVQGRVISPANHHQQRAKEMFVQKQ